MTPDDDPVEMTITFSESELATIDEIVEQLRDLHDPDMGRDRLLGRIHLKASRALLRGEIEDEEIKTIVQELVAVGVIHRHREELPENPTPGDVEHFAAEIEAELANVENTRRLFPRAMFVIALNDWRAYGLGPFREKWLGA